MKAIILAAGLSRRYGQANKLFQSINGKAMISNVVNEIVNSKVNDVLVITGYEADLIQKVVGSVKKVKFIYNRDFLLVVC